MAATMISTALLWLCCVLPLCCGASVNETSTDVRPVPAKKVSPPLDRPSVIRIVSVSAVTSSSANVAWTSSGVDGKLTVKLERVGDGNLSRVAETGGSSMRIGDLEAWTLYRVQVSGRAKGSNASIGAEVQFRTEAAAPSPPRHLEVVRVDSTSVSLRWQPPIHFRGPLKGYAVSYGRQDDRRMRSELLVKATNATISNLTPYTKLAVDVKSLGALSNGTQVVSDAVSVQVTTHVAAPTKVLKLHLVSVGVRFADIEWDAPSRSNGPLDGYLVYSCAESGEERSQCKTIHLANKTGCRVEQMTPDTPYSIFVTAFNHKADGTGTLLSSAEKIFVHTLQEPPGPVGDVRIKTLSADSIAVSWDASHGADGYVVAWCQNHTCVERSTNETRVEIGGLHPSSDYNVSVDPYRIDTRGDRLLGPLRTTHVTLAAVQEGRTRYLTGTLVSVPIVAILAVVAVCFWKQPCRKCVPTTKVPGIYKRMSSLEHDDDDVLFMKTVPSK